MRESDIESYLVKRVKAMKGEVRKVAWIGRGKAPDRVVMLPRKVSFTRSPNIVVEQTIWVELKAPGLAATFPADAHERAQHREHQRMRAMGQRVEVVDSFSRVDEVLS